MELHKDYKIIDNQSCENCRFKKAKCIKSGSKCDNCIKNECQCVFPILQRSRGVKKGYIRQLEDRLLNFKKLLRDCEGHAPKEFVDKCVMYIDETLSFGRKELQNHSIDKKKQTDIKNRLKLNRKEFVKMGHTLIGTEKVRVFFGESSAACFLGQEFTSEKYYKFPELNNSKKEACLIQNIGNRIGKDTMDHLLFIYMKYFNSIFPIVNNTLLKNKLDTFLDFNSFCSEEFPLHLVYAMLANSCILADLYFPINNINLFKLGCDCFEMAKDIIHQSSLYKKNCLSTIQTLLLLSTTTNPRNKFTVWLYSGMATRMAIDLGLNTLKNYSQNSQNNDRINVWWCCYIVDKFSGIIGGRPSVIDNKEFITALPTNSNPENMVKNEDCEISNENTTEFFNRFIELARITDRIYTTIYSVKPRQKLTALRFEMKVKELDSELENWYIEVSRKINSTESNNPFKLLIIYYHTLKVLLYRPLLSTIKEKESLGIVFDKCLKTADTTLHYTLANIEAYTKYGMLFKLYPVSIILSIYFRNLLVKENKTADEINETMDRISKCCFICYNVLYQLPFSKKIIMLVTEVLYNKNITLSIYLNKNNVPKGLIKIAIAHENLLNLKYNKKENSRSSSIHSNHLPVDTDSSQPEFDKNHTKYEYLYTNFQKNNNTTTSSNEDMGNHQNVLPQEFENISQYFFNDKYFNDQKVSILGLNQNK